MTLFCTIGTHGHFGFSNRKSPLTDPPERGIVSSQNLQQMHQHTYRRKVSILAGSILSVTALMLGGHAQAQSVQGFIPGNLVVLRSTYEDQGEIANVVPNVTTLPTSTNTVAAGDGTFGNVLLNTAVDGNFGVTSPIFLDQITNSGTFVNSLNVTAAAGGSFTTSFTSRSEGALNLSQDGTSLTFIGYNAPIGAIDRSNASTPGVTNFTNTDTATPTFKVVGQVDASGNLSTTLSNAYSGDNGRAAILGNNGVIYAVGNTGSTVTTSSPTAASVTGVQYITPGVNATASSPGTQSAGSYSVTQNGYTADKLAKDNNFRGETIFNNTLYVTKGSGTQGINSVYMVGTAGSLPTGSSNTISILPGFNTTLEKTAETGGNTNLFHPSGLWFANAATLYVADEGNNLIADETTPDTNNPNAGLQKWVNSKPDGTGTWTMIYNLRAGLNLGQAYSTPGYMTGSNAITDVATDGLREITGKVNADGSVTIYAVTSTISSAGDPGADPNELVAITDTIADSTALQATGESFSTIDSPVVGNVIRGVSFAPTPEPTSAAMLGLGLLALGGVRRRNRS